MALTEEQAEAAREEYRRRLATIELTKRDGQTVQFAAPVGNYDYLDLAALSKILRHLGYDVTGCDGEARLQIAPTIAAAEEAR